MWLLLGGLPLFFQQVTDEESPASLGISADYLAFEDADVTAERARVMGLPDHSAHPLVLKNLQKTYPTGKTALKTLTLAVEPDLVFGLLGPNGNILKAETCRISSI